MLAVFAAPQGGNTDHLALLAARALVGTRDALTLNVRVAPPSPWRRLRVIAALFIAAWIMRGWRRPRAAKVRRRRPQPSARRLVEVVELGPPSGWRGRVLDAHDGTVPGARIQIRSGFVGDGVAARPSAFEVASSSGRCCSRRLRLEAGGRWHATLVKPSRPRVSLDQPRHAPPRSARAIGRVGDSARPRVKTEQTPRRAHCAARPAPARAGSVRWRTGEEAAYGPLSP